MKARILDRQDVLKIVDQLRDQGYEVMAPFVGLGRDTYFDKVTDENRDRIQMHLPNPYYPPKRFVLPQIEQTMKINTGGGGIKIEPTYQEPKLAISASAPATWRVSTTDRFIWGSIPTSR
jgi:hypothetical protein